MSPLPESEAVRALGRAYLAPDERQRLDPIEGVEPPLFEHIRSQWLGMRRYRVRRASAAEAALRRSFQGIVAECLVDEAHRDRTLSSVSLPLIEDLLAATDTSAVSGFKPEVVKWQLFNKIKRP